MTLSACLLALSGATDDATNVCRSHAADAGQTGLTAVRLRSSTTPHSTAGRRAAALCVSPMSSRETAREGPTKSGGDGSLQTMVEGVGPAGNSDHRAPGTSSAGAYTLLDISLSRTVGAAAVCMRQAALVHRSTEKPPSRP